MKPSNYNFIWPVRGQEKVIIFNSRTTALIEVEKTKIDLLTLGQFEYDSLSPDEKKFVNDLKFGGFVLDDVLDEIKILKFTYNNIKYNGLGLGLTIAPTLQCNFDCSYCYEKSIENQSNIKKENQYMSEKTQQELLKFIENAAKTANNVSIAWYGGEPLLAKEIIFDLTEKIMSITEENKIRYSANMITNGYLIAVEPDLIQKLKDSQINSFQITIDGPPDIHNSRRKLKKNQGPTFDEVLEAIKLLKENDIMVSLRINVDHSNMDGVLKLLDILEVNNLKDIPLHLGHISSNSTGCNSIEGSCATMEEFTLLNQTFHETLRLGGFETGQTPYYPDIAYPCCANQMNSFVIDSDGDIFKCWSEIGEKSARIGNITDLPHRKKEEQMHEIQWMTWEPFEYTKCLECKLLPICMGGCSYKTMFVDNERPNCGEWKYSLEHYVRIRYDHEKKKITGRKS